MISIRGASADAVWRKSIATVQKRGRFQPGRDQATKEVLHAAITIEAPRDRLVFALPLNPAFLIAETVWILAGRDDLPFVSAWNGRMKRWSDDGQRLHGSYGKRLISHFGGLDQLRAAYETLEADPSSRQVVLQYWDPSTDLPRPVVRSKDIPCNLSSHLLLRGGRLEWLQIMRSNDLIWGTPTNIFQFTTLQEIVAGWLRVQPGSYNHISDSLHVYERHWALLQPQADQPLPPRNQADLRLSYAKFNAIWPRLETITQSLGHATTESGVDHALAESKSLPPAYGEWMRVLAAESFRRQGLDERSMEVIQECAPFLATSWIQWADSKAAPGSKRLRQRFQTQLSLDSMPDGTLI